MRKNDLQNVIEEVTRRVLERALRDEPAFLSAQSRKDPAFLGAQSRKARTSPSAQTRIEHLLYEVLYYERKRLESDTTTVTRKQDEQWLQSVRARFYRSNLRDKKELLEEIITRHVEEVGGHFSPPVYGFSTRIVPPLLGLLLNAASPLGLVRRGGRPPEVADRLVLSGSLAQIRRLARHATFVFVPTHSSNLDSIIMGYAVYRAGLPPLTYGAGINLFQHRFLGFFMNRLGAYKVDRLKQHRLYKWVLKTYATVTMEKGYPNLFFPGGTRSRSGAVEQSLKLGLLGCCVEAYKNNIKHYLSTRRRTGGGVALGVAANNAAGVATKDATHAVRPLFVVPCTLNYQLVLEAETLIEDHLKAAGKSRFIITDDEFSRLDRIAQFLRSLFTLNADIHVRFGPVLDALGNRVDPDGRSVDGGGRPLDPTRYFMRQNTLVEDRQRDQIYTQLLGQTIGEAFKQETVVFSTHVLAWTVFGELYRRRRDRDFYRFLRETAYEISLPMVEVYEKTAAVMAQVKKRAGQNRLQLGSALDTATPEEVVDKALRLFACYHEKPIVTRKGDRLVPGDMNLLYYYRNRLWGMGLD
jgi:glycerol-3-phosphate O-acyltransferase